MSRRLIWAAPCANTGGTKPKMIKAIEVIITARNHRQGRTANWRSVKENRTDGRTRSCAGRKTAQACCGYGKERCGGRWRRRACLLAQKQVAAAYSPSLSLRIPPQRVDPCIVKRACLGKGDGSRGLSGNLNCAISRSQRNRWPCKCAEDHLWQKPPPAR